MTEPWSHRWPTERGQSRWPGGSITWRFRQPSHNGKTCSSSDGGVDWSKVEDATALRDPSCMASIFRYTDPADGDKSRSLFSGPQSDRRETGTVLLSYDEGATWPVRRTLVKDRFAYSDLTALGDGTIGCLFEADGMNRIVFARFAFDCLTDGKDRPAKNGRSD